MTVMDRIAAKLDGFNGVAKTLGVYPSAVSQWRHDVRSIPLDRCAQIERATEGAVTCEEMRPDAAWVRVPDPDWPHPQGRPLLDVAAARAKAAA